MPATIWLNCIIEGEDVGFAVPVGPEDVVSDLKNKIKKECAVTFEGVDVRHLELWKHKDFIDAKPTDTLVERIRALGHDLSKFAVKLDSLETVFSIFPIQPRRDHIHIIVEGSHTRNTSRASPKPLETMSARKETVAALYKKLEAYRFIQVRGTPASGKSTLADLLSRHIEALEPFTPVIWITGWSETIAVSDTWREHLQNNKRWDENIASVLIFDEAQMTYVDTGLWNTLFKTISDNPSIPYHRIIIFTSYGSPTRINKPVTSMLIREQQMVTLVPIDHHDGLGAVGLYLTWPEFEEFANIRKYSFDPACLDFIFRISSGHAGAINDVIQVISSDDSYRKITASQKLFTISDFSKYFTSHCLYAGLQGASIFRRGLPGNDVLQTQSVAHVLRTALRNKVIVDTMFPGTEESEALGLCFAQGWLHTDKGVSENPEIAGYFFASTLHRLFVEWKLSDENQAIPIQAPSLLEFVIEIIQRFCPLNLSHPRTVGPYYFQSLPEAQYQDEFYRCCYDLTTGSLATLSEFGTADGRVDFYIPPKKWAVELLRDGQRLEQHNASFSSMGQYGKTLDIDDYIVLDLGTKKVTRAHPHLTNLFHVIFSDDYHNVVINDSEHGTIREFSLVQTQS